MSQNRVVDQATDPQGEEQDTQEYRIYYREINAEKTTLNKGVIGKDNNTEFRNLLLDIESKTGGHHNLDSDLDVTNFQEKWITNLLEDPEDEGSAEDLAEHFSENMETRAKADGKYVIVICKKDKLVVCHAYSGKKAVTTNTNIVKQLLSPSNIDKYASFEGDEEFVKVKHYDKYDTKSFSSWLGIRDEEVVFDIKGDVKIYTEVGGLGCTFKFRRDEVLEKLIQSDEYDLSESLFQTPDGDYSIRKIRWGSDHYQDGEEFKQELLMVEHQVKHYKQKYDEIKGNIENWMVDIIDRQNDLILKSQEDTDKRIKKLNGDFTPVFVSNRIEMDSGWRSSLKDRFIGDYNNKPIFHAGGKFSENPFPLGNFRIYNDIGWSIEQQNLLNSLSNLAEEEQGGKFHVLISLLVFKYASLITKSECMHFFECFCEFYEERVRRNYSEGSTVIQKEDVDIGIEYKAKDWISGEGNTEIVEKISGEVSKGSKVILVGIDEQNGRTLDLVPSNRFESDRLSQLTEDLDNEKNLSVEAIPIPIEDDNLICFLETEL